MAEPHPLEISDVHFSYNGHKVLESVSLRIQSGEIVGLIGPNGSGKSTLMKLSIGLLQPEKGLIKVFGNAPSTWRQRDLAQRIAYVPQSVRLPPQFTVWESTLLGRTPYLGFLGMASEHDRHMTQRALDWVGIASLAKRQVGQLSGGERQRVILARALAQEPSCLLLDEPTTHLDIHHQVTILSLVHNLVNERGLSALAVMHDLNLASTFADYLIFLSEGRVIAKGSPQEVLTPDLLLSIYGHNVTTFPHPDDIQRPVVLPKRPLPDSARS